MADSDTMLMRTWVLRPGKEQERMVYIRFISSLPGGQHNESQELHGLAQLHTKAGVLRPLLLGAVTARLSSTFL